MENMKGKKMESEIATVWNGELPEQIVTFSLIGWTDCAAKFLNENSILTSHL